MRDAEEDMKMQGLCEEGLTNAAWDQVGFGEAYREYLETDDDARAALTALDDRLASGESLALICYENTGEKAVSPDDSRGVPRDADLSKPGRVSTRRCTNSRPRTERTARSHGLVKTVVTPRPIAWISTVSDAGVDTLVPFSSYNYVSLKEPTVLFNTPNGERSELKDTARKCSRERRIRRQHRHRSRYRADGPHLRGSSGRRE